MKKFYDPLFDKNSNSNLINFETRKNQETSGLFKFEKKPDVQEVIIDKKIKAKFDPETKIVSPIFSNKEE